MAHSILPTDEREHQTLLLLNDPHAQAVETIRTIATELDVDPDELLERAQQYLEQDEYWSEGNRFDSESIPASFWPAYEVLTQTAVPADKQYSFLSCSC